MKPYLFASPMQRLYCIAAIILLILFSCQKSDKPARPEKQSHVFTVLPDSADGRLLRLTDSLLVSEASRPWMDSVIKNIGIPGWEYTIWGQQLGATAAMVPLIDLNNRQVTGLLVLVDGSTDFKFNIIDSRVAINYKSKERRNTATPRQIFIVTDLFNQRVFSHASKPIQNEKMMTRQERDWIATARQTNNPGLLRITSAYFSGSSKCYTTAACIGDGSGNCVGEIYYSTSCVFEYIWSYLYFDSSTEGSGSGSGSGAVDPYDPAGGGSGEASLVVLPPTKPIRDVKKYVACFDHTQGAKVTFYADQPQEGSDEPFTMKGKVGHSFVTIEQFIGGQIIRRTIGFHPYESVSPFFTKSTSGQLGDDSEEEYDVRLDVNISADILDKVLYLIENHNPNYHLEEYNCTNFVLDISDACGVNIPRNKSSWVFGKGLNPAKFGEDLKKMAGAKVQKGHSTKNAGDCL